MTTLIIINCSPFGLIGGSKIFRSQLIYSKDFVIFFYSIDPSAEYLQEEHIPECVLVFWDKFVEDELNSRFEYSQSTDMCSQLCTLI